MSSGHGDLGGVGCPRRRLPILKVQDADTLVYLDDCQVDQCLCVSSQKLLATGSPVFKTLLSPPKQFRVLRRKKLLRDGLPIGIKFVIDMTPPEEGDEAIEAVENLDLPSCVLGWKSAVQAPFIEEDDDESMVEKWAQENHQFVTRGLDSKLSRDLQHFYDQFIKPKPRLATNPSEGPIYIRDQEEDAEEDAEENNNDAASNEGNPIDFGGPVETDMQEPKLPPVPLPPPYSISRHRAAIQRLLYMLHDSDPRIRSSSMWYTVYKLSIMFGCGPSIRDYLVKWLFWDNILFLELFPRLVLQMAEDVKAGGLFRDAFALLVTGSIVPGQNGADKRGEGLNISGSKWEQNVKHAQQKFMARVQGTYDLLSSLDWLHSLPSVTRLQEEVVNNPSVPQDFRESTADLFGALNQVLGVELRHLTYETHVNAPYISETSWQLATFLTLPKEKRIYSAFFWNERLPALAVPTSWQLRGPIEWWYDFAARYRQDMPLLGQTRDQDLLAEGKGPEIGTEDTSLLKKFMRKTMVLRPRNNKSNGKEDDKPSGDYLDSPTDHSAQDHDHLLDNAASVAFDTQNSALTKTAPTLPNLEGNEIYNRLEEVDAFFNDLEDDDTTVCGDEEDHHLPRSSSSEQDRQIKKRRLSTEGVYNCNFSMEETSSTTICKGPPAAPVPPSIWTEDDPWLRQRASPYKASFHPSNDETPTSYMYETNPGHTLQDTGLEVFGTSRNVYRELPDRQLTRLFSLPELSSEIEGYISSVIQPIKKNLFSWSLRDSQTLCCLEDSDWEEFLPIWAGGLDDRISPIEEVMDASDHSSSSEMVGIDEGDAGPAESEVGSQFTMIGTEESSFVELESAGSTDNAVWSMDGSRDDRTWEDYKEEIEEERPLVEPKKDIENEGEIEEPGSNSDMDIDDLEDYEDAEIDLGDDLYDWA